MLGTTCTGLCRCVPTPMLGLMIKPALKAGLKVGPKVYCVSLGKCLNTDDSRCVQAFLQTNSDLRLFCPSKRIADLVSRSPGRNTSAFLYYFSRGPRPGDWLSNQQVRPSSLLSDADCVQRW